MSFTCYKCYNVYDIDNIILFNSGHELCTSCNIGNLCEVCNIYHDSIYIYILKCEHIVCINCYTYLSSNNCPICRHYFNDPSDINRYDLSSDEEDLLIFLDILDPI